MSGAQSYFRGHAAEHSVARSYIDSGLELYKSRWRSSRCEIDLIFKDENGYVFVEVKSSKSHRSAVSLLTSAQIKRQMRAGEEFAANHPCDLNTNFRFDVALVDQSGRIEILENAYSHF